MVNQPVPDDAIAAFLFHCRHDPTLRAISVDPTAGNIETRQCVAGWALDGQVTVGIQDVMPVALAPEPVLRGLRNTGFYVWKEGSNPKSTSQ